MTKPTYIDLLSVLAGKGVANGLSIPTYIVLVSVFSGKGIPILTHVTAKKKLESSRIAAFAIPITVAFAKRIDRLASARDVGARSIEIAVGELAVGELAARD